MTRGADVLIVEGVGGILTPMDFSHTILDVAAWLGLPVVIVARAGLGTINHTLLTINAIRDRRLKIAGVVINRYPAETPGVAEETNPRAIERWGKTNVICVVPEAEEVKFGALAPDVIAAIGMVDWEGKL
jgi:dethiobiotin synthetase